MAGARGGPARWEGQRGKGRSLGTWARALAAVLAGVAALLAVSKYALSVDLGSAISMASSLPIPLLTTVIALRALGPLVHATQFYMVMRSYGHRLDLRRTLLIVYSSLALEYAVPVGGAVEVGRTALLVREGLGPGGALEVVFAHRLVHSVSAAAEVFLVALLLHRVDAVVLWLAAAVAATNLLNIAAFASARSRRVSGLLERLSSRLGARWEVPVSPKRPRVGPLCAALLLVGLEKALAALGGHLVLSGLGHPVNLAYSLVLFDAILVTFWLLPIVTPAGIGQVETVQLLASAAMGVDPEAATASVVLYRLATLVAILSQLLVALLGYGVGEVLRKPGSGQLGVERPRPDRAAGGRFRSAGDPGRAPAGEASGRGGRRQSTAVPPSMLLPVFDMSSGYGRVPRFPGPTPRPRTGSSRGQGLASRRRAYCGSAGSSRGGAYMLS